MTNYKLHLYFPRWWGWVGGWVGVVIIKLKAYLSSDWTGTELGNKLNSSGMFATLIIPFPVGVAFFCYIRLHHSHQIHAQ